MKALKNWIVKQHRRNVYFGNYPGSLKSAIAVLSISTAVSVLILKDGDDKDLIGIFKFLQRNDCMLFNDNVSEVLSHLLAGLVIWFVLCLLRKVILRECVRFLGQQTISSWKVKLCVFLIKILHCWSNPITKNLYGCQDILPALPVPKLQLTIDKYIESIRSLESDVDFAMTLRKAKQFMNTTGPKLQRYLYLKYLYAPNYVSDWWEKYIYLTQRTSLLTTSNVYLLDVKNEMNLTQAARAALMTYGTTTLHQQIKNYSLKPQLVGQDIIPLCNWQFHRFFCSYRIPGETTDTLEQYENSGHAVVYHNGKYFKINVFHDEAQTKRLNPAELQTQFLRILSDQSEPAAGEEKLAALTAWDRVSWTQIRNNILANGVNKESLDAIESSICMICLDDQEFSVKCANEGTVDVDEGSPADNFAQAILAGNGHNRWLDKSLYIVGTNGRCGVLAEHSGVDGAAAGYLWEMLMDYCINFNEVDGNGKITTSVKTVPPPVERLKWKLPIECIAAIEIASAEAKTLTMNVDVRIFGFESFGKGFMKKCRVGPDAFVQMALQLAYYRDQGKFEATYEATTTRFFLQGRTETIRSCTVESCRWVLSMENTDLSSPEKIKYFREACNKHQENSRQSMIGKGCDRHLFALYVMSKYLNVDSPFLKEAMTRPWKLSTSQLPFSQIKSKQLQWLGGGFGPVAPDGYGVSYIFTTENMTTFQVSSLKSCPATDSLKFSKAIQRALLDIQELFSDK